MSMSISIQKSTKRTNINHNNRTMSEREKKINNHIDYSRSDENKYLIQEDIRDIYEREFGEALENYNAKQRRADRKIKDYYKHIEASKKTSTQQEMIIQIGDKDDFTDEDNRKLANEILEEWFQGFEERNPNLKVYNAVIHNDEASPHMHLNFVPVASGYKRGLEKQVAFDRAIKQQDKTLDKDRPFEDWREKEVKLLEKLLLERGIERKIVGKNEYKDVNELKKITAEREKLKKERELLEEEKKSFFQHREKKINTDDLKIRYSHKEKKTEVYEDIEKNILGFERKVRKHREIETGNIVFTPEQAKELIQVLNNAKELKADYERLNGVLNDEINLRKKLEREHQKQLNTVKSELNQRAERLKDDKYKSLEKENSELKSRLNGLADDHKKISTEKQGLAEKLELAVEDNERLYNENDKLRESVEYYKWKFERLWSVSKAYLQERGKDAVETVKMWFRMETGEEIEPKSQKQKNKSRGWDMEL